MKSLGIMSLYLILICWSLFNFCCKKNSNVLEDEVRSFEWHFASPASQGFNAELLSEVINNYSQLPYVTGLLIMRNGYMIVEEYYDMYDQATAINVHSVSKSFTSACVGIALEKGFLTSLDQKMMDFFPEYAVKIRDARKYEITLRHLITMQAGFDWDETIDNWREYASSPDWVEYALTLPLKYDPGTYFHYSTPQTNLLSVILSKATHQTAKQFADYYLFAPLDISTAAWYQDPQGYYTGGHEMYFLPRYLIKFGYLYLNRGLFDGYRILCADWIDESVQNHISTGASGYGYGWWTDRIADYNVYSARGRGGQYILVVPDLELIVVTTTEIESWDFGAIQASTVYSFLDQIVTAACGDDYTY